MNGDTTMDKQRPDEIEFLASYDVSQFERPSLTVDMLIFTITDEDTGNYRKLPQKVLKLLLVKRGVHPFMGKWALPGGFIRMEESLDEAAARELKSETNIDNIYMEQLYTWGDVKRDPRTRVISCSYLALIDSESLEVKPGDDADDAKWLEVSYRIDGEQRLDIENGYVSETLSSIDLKDKNDAIFARIKTTTTVNGKVTSTKSEILESNGLSFDHAKMIVYAIERLKNKLEYTDIVFSLMKDKFTLTELQQVYEVILGKEQLAANFRRKIAHMVTETEEYTKDAGHRPSKLFRFNPEWKKKL
ncbi:MAG TPA: NUDIX domain-containing protein [Clostridia bacterium]